MPECAVGACVTGACRSAGTAGAQAGEGARTDSYARAGVRVGSGIVVKGGNVRAAIHCAPEHRRIVGCVVRAQI